MANLIYSSLDEDGMLTCCSTIYDSSSSCLSSPGRRIKGRASAAHATSILYLDVNGRHSYTAPAFRGGMGKAVWARHKRTRMWHGQEIGRKLLTAEGRHNPARLLSLSEGGFVLSCQIFVALKCFVHSLVGHRVSA